MTASEKEKLLRENKALEAENKELEKKLMKLEMQNLIMGLSTKVSEGITVEDGRHFTADEVNSFRQAFLKWMELEPEDMEAEFDVWMESICSTVSSK